MPIWVQDENCAQLNRTYRVYHRVASEKNAVPAVAEFFIEVDETVGWYASLQRSVRRVRADLLRQSGLNTSIRKRQSCAGKAQKLPAYICLPSLCGSLPVFWTSER